MRRIIATKHLRDCILQLTFDDGVSGEVDIARCIPFDGVFDRLNDPGFFKKVHINQKWGAIEWPGGLDLDTESLYEEATGIRISFVEEERVPEPI